MSEMAFGSDENLYRTEATVLVDQRQWCWSDNEDNGYYGPFETEKEAAYAALNDEERALLQSIWIGRVEKLTASGLLDLGDAYLIIENLAENLVDYRGQIYGDIWYREARCQSEPLYLALKSAIERWANEHDLQPPDWMPVEIHRCEVIKDGETQRLMRLDGTVI